MNGIVEQLNSMGDSFVRFAVPMLIQSSLLIAVILGLDLLLRKKVRAVLRYWLWVLVLVKLVLPTTLSAPTTERAKVALQRLGGARAAPPAVRDASPQAAQPGAKE